MPYAFNQSKHPFSYANILIKLNLLKSHDMS
jgi:hypothetical protein